MKKCFKCLKMLPLDEFYKNSSMSDGRVNKCKECTLIDVHANRQKNLESIRAYDRLRASMPHRVAAMKEYTSTDAYKTSHLNANSLYRKNNKKKVAAHNAVNKAILSGKLIPWCACSIPNCNETIVEAHHPDYDSPLDVVWLCSNHHKEIHRDFRKMKKKLESTLNLSSKIISP